MANKSVERVKSHVNKLQADVSTADATEEGANGKAREAGRCSRGCFLSIHVDFTSLPHFFFFFFLTLD